VRSLLGLHWIRVHPDQHDLPHIERMQYRSVKLFEWHWSNRDACRDLQTVLPKDAYILARDHPMSEQKQDMFANPVGTGTRHANEWAKKVATGNYHMPTERTFFLGVNEPDATSGDRNAIDLYTAAFLDRLRVHGLRGGAFNFSTGHPRTVDGTGATRADYSVFERSRQAIVAGHHIAILHIYGTTHVPCVPGHYDRLKACPWTDVEWIVGECGIDEHVIGGGNHDGYLRTMGVGDAYCHWLDQLIMGINDKRIHSYQVFTHDFSHPWDSFDIRPIRPHLEAYNWQHVTIAPAKPVKTHLPSVSTPPTQLPVGIPNFTPPQPAAPVPPLAHPIANVALRTISQRFGENPAAYARFGLAGHTGVDFAVPHGTPIGAVDSGIVQESGSLPDYGEYVKVRHPWGESLYAHLSARKVEAGEPVNRGSIIGRSGNTGNSTAPHLHFAIRIYPYQRGAPHDGFSDPLPYLQATAEPAPQPATVLAAIDRAAGEFGIEWQLLASLAWAESSWNPRAVSGAGALGLCQIMPATWREWTPKIKAGDDPFDATQNARLGAAYLMWLLGQTNGNLYQALQAYVWGIGNVLSGTPPPDEVVAYSAKIVHGRDLLKAVGA
jgi:murein DD-endopeptidase MepM/ murein hydrolase activator NlpD